MNRRHAVGGELAVWLNSSLIGSHAISIIDAK